MGGSVSLLRERDVYIDDETKNCFRRKHARDFSFSSRVRVSCKKQYLRICCPHPSERHMIPLLMMNSARY